MLAPFGRSGQGELELERAERLLIDLVKMGPEGPSSAKIFSHYPRGLLDADVDCVLLREAKALIAPDTPPDDQALHALVDQTRQQLKAADPRLLPFEMALIAGGKKPQAWLERGRARAQLGEWELAQADFAMAIAMAPNDPEVLATRCLIYAELNRVAEAIADLDTVLDKEADNIKSPGWLAARQRLFDNLGQWPAFFEHVVRLRPTDPSPWVGRARYHISRMPWSNQIEGASSAEKAVADLREAAKRGFRDFDQPRTDAGWQTLESREDFKQLVRETPERNADDLMLLAKLDAHTDVVRRVALLPEGQRVVSIGRDKQVCLWDLPTRREVSRVAVEGYLRDADVSADGRLVAVLSSEGEKKGVAHVWDLEKQVRFCELVQDFKWANAIRLSPDGKRLVTSGVPGYGVLWDVATEKKLRRLDLGETSHTKAIAFSPDGKLLALGAVGRVWLFDGESGDPHGDVLLPNNRAIPDLAFDPSGKTLASGQMGGHVTLIDVETRRVLKVLQDSDSYVSNVRFVNNDRFLLCSSDAALQIWDIQREKVVSAAKTAKGTTDRMTVSPDGRHAFTASGEQWDTATNRALQNGDYALRLWQLPRSVWLTEPANSSTANAVAKPEQD